MSDIHDYALSILKEHGCDIHTYGDCHVSVDSLENELREAYPDGMQYPHRDVAQAILDISKPTFKSIPEEGFDFEDWGSWGVTDFYDETREELESALKSGKPFNTGWHGAKKELESMQIVRDYENTVVCVHAYMDELYEQSDLINDCLTDDESNRITDDMIDEIRDVCMFSDCVDECDESETLPLDASLEDIEKCASKLLDLCEKRLKDSFQMCIGITLSILYGESDETNKLIDERIKKYA